MQNNIKTGQPLKIWVFPLLLVLATAAGSRAEAACYIADVPEAMVMPDDSVHQAGQLEICLTRMFSPVAGFHRITVDGRVAGLFRSRVLTESPAEGDEKSYFVFARLPDGTYELDSFANLDGQKRVKFAMRGEVRTRWRVGRTNQDGKVVLPASPVAAED